MKWSVLVPLPLIFLRPCARRSIYLEHPCSQRTLSFPLRSWQYSSIFPVSALRTAFILYSGLMVGSTACLIPLLKICWIFGGNRTGVDTKLTDSSFSRSLRVGRVVRWLRYLFQGATGSCDEGWGVERGNGVVTGVGFFGIYGCFGVFGIFVALFFCWRICLVVAVISINPEVFICVTLGESAGVLIVIIDTLGRFYGLIQLVLWYWKIFHWVLLVHDWF